MGPGEEISEGRIGFLFIFHVVYKQRNSTKFSELQITEILTSYPSANLFHWSFLDE